MFFDDRHKAVATIISKRGPKGGERTMEATPMKPEKMMSEGGEVDGRHTAAQDIIAAHKEGSAMKLVEALSNFMDLHLHSQEEDQESGATPV